MGVGPVGVTLGVGPPLLGVGYLSSLLVAMQAWRFPEGSCPNLVGTLGGVTGGYGPWLSLEAPGSSMQVAPKVGTLWQPSEEGAEGALTL